MKSLRLRHTTTALLMVLLLALTAGCGQGGAKSGSESSQSSGGASSPAPAPASSGSQGAQPAAPESGGTLTVALQGDITSLDPAFAYDFATGPVVNNVSEGLLRFAPDGKLINNLAESWEVSPDGLVYTYHLRQGVTFHDGSPMTADDVVFSMERHRDEALASYVAWMFSNVASIEKVDDKTVKVTLTQPDAFWQYVPATSGGHVISKQYIESHPNFGKPDGGTMGTGPFKFVSWTTGSEVVLEANPNYWDPEAGPHFDKIVFKVLPEGTTRVTGLKTGEIQVSIGNIPVDQLPLVEKMENLTVVKAPGAMVNFVAFNNAKPPFNDANLRKAIAHAIDSQAIHQQIAGGASDAPRATLVGPGLWGAEKAAWEAATAKLPVYEYNLEKARQYLAQSGYPNGVKTTLITDNDPVRLNFALALQSAVAPLGIEIEVQKVTWEELITYLLGNHDYEMIMDLWGSDFPDPAGNLVAMMWSENMGEGGSNQLQYSNPAVDELLVKQNTSTDPAERTQLLTQAQALAAADLPFIIVDYPYQIAAFDKSLSGYELSALWYWDGWARDLKRN